MPDQHLWIHIGDSYNNGLVVLWPVGQVHKPDNWSASWDWTQNHAKETQSKPECAMNNHVYHWSQPSPTLPFFHWKLKLSEYQTDLRENKSVSSKKEIWNLLEMTYQDSKDHQELQSESYWITLPFLFSPPITMLILFSQSLWLIYNKTLIQKMLTVFKLPTLELQSPKPSVPSQIPTKLRLISSTHGKKLSACSKTIVSKDYIPNPIKKRKILPSLDWEKLLLKTRETIS